MSNYLEDNKDFKLFLDSTSDRTGEKNMDVWVKNLADNRAIFQHSDGWATAHLQDVEKGKTAIIMGASPHIQTQVETLRDIQDDPQFVLCGLSSNLEWLLNNGIRPKYVITIDADPSQGDFWTNLDMEKTRGITLIANTFNYPKMLETWKGKLYFLAFDSEGKKLARKQRKYYHPLNGIGAGFIALMGQFNTMTAFAFLCLGCPIILFVGNEMSYKDLEIQYYVDRVDPRDKEARYPHGDIHGNIVYTTPGLLALKLCLEHFLERISGAGWFFNCSEAGIFGITKRFPDLHVPWIKQLTLKNGIAQSRHIMRTGEPFYEFGAKSLITKGGYDKQKALDTLLAVENKHGKKKSLMISGG